MTRRLGSLLTPAGLLASLLVTLGTVVGASSAQAASFQDWKSVDAGKSHSCGVRNNGKLYCWGYNGNGQIGDGTIGAGIHRLNPTRIGEFADWTSVATSAAHSCGVRDPGKLYCWGFNGDGQVGDNTSGTDRSNPIRIGGFQDWKNAATGASHSCGVRNNGKLYCWGNNDHAQIGDNTSGTDRKIPTRIGGFEDWTSASAGGSHSCAVRNNGKLYCWGYNAYGQIGDDVAGPWPTPRRVSAFEDWTGASAGEDHSCGVRNNVKLYCWGYNAYGQVGDGTSDTFRFAPVRI